MDPVIAVHCLCPRTAALPEYTLRLSVLVGYIISILYFCPAMLAEYSTCLYFCTYCSRRVQAVPGKVGVDGEVLLRAREHGVYF